MGYCVGGKWIEMECVKCGNIIKIYTTDPMWLFIQEHKNCNCEKCDSVLHYMRNL
jgi:hypothetical protein